MLASTSGRESIMNLDDMRDEIARITHRGIGMPAAGIAYWPIVVVVAQTAPEWTIYTMAVLFGSHFIPYGWFYRSAGYLGLGIGSIVVPTALVLAGVRAPEHIALAMAAMYVACVVRLHFENKRTFALAAA